MDATLEDLQDITSLNGSKDGVSTAVGMINDSDNNKLGWYLEFENDGEKVLSHSVTYANEVLFTTYIPPSSKPGRATNNVKVLLERRVFMH